MELEALQAIYEEELQGPDHLGWFSIKICGTTKKEGQQSSEKLCKGVWLSFLFHSTYPDHNLPQMKLSSLPREEEEVVLDYIKANHFQPEEECMFAVISWLMSELCTFLHREAYKNQIEEEEEEEEIGTEIEIFSGESATDRKSKFIAHGARVNSAMEVERVVEQLKTNHKIAKATHNIVAYRIRMSDGTLDQHRDDDGEGGAGDRLLELLDRCNVENIVIVVTRWYGGIHLGPDRFKHINDRALFLLRSQGWIMK